MQEELQMQAIRQNREEEYMLEAISDFHGSKEKLAIKKQYESGGIKCLVAVRCLDEGVDIPKIKRLYLVHGALADRRQWIPKKRSSFKTEQGRIWKYPIRGFCRNNT